jgi:hypothetical protein
LERDGNRRVKRGSQGQTDDIETERSQPAKGQGLGIRLVIERRFVRIEYEDLAIR